MKKKEIAKAFGVSSVGERDKEHRELNREKCDEEFFKKSLSKGRSVHQQVLAGSNSIIFPSFKNNASIACCPL